MVEVLNKAKEWCQKNQQSDTWVTLLTHVPLRVYRSGITRGQNGTHYPFKIRYCGIVIGLGDWNASERAFDNVYICLKGRECLLLNGWRAYDEVCELIRLLSGKVIRERLSRADICLDIANLAASELQQVVERRQFVTRMKCVTPYVELVSGKHTGFSAGKSPQRLICYDKVNELMGGSDQLYVRAWADKRHGGEIPEVAARVEVQLRRRYLKQFGIDSPSDFKQNASGLFTRFLDEQLRLVDRRIKPGTRNQGRAKTLPAWADLQEVALPIFGNDVRQLVRVDRSRVDPRQLIKQAAGCLRTALLQRGVPLDDFEEFEGQSLNLFEKVFSKPEDRKAFIEDYRNRETEFRT
jgi:hypothetical protein